MDVLIVGSLAYDSLETPVGSREDELGGSASYGGFSAAFHNRKNGGEESRWSVLSVKISNQSILSGIGNQVWKLTVLKKTKAKHSVGKVPIMVVWQMQ